jgi:hypothetical protein
MVLRGIAGWSRGSVIRRAAAVTGVAAIAGATAFVWWPNGDYAPIRPGERGTIGEMVSSVPAIASGRPSFTPDREQRYGSEPTVRERAAAAAGRRDGGRGPLDRGATQKAPGVEQDFDDGGTVPEDEYPATDGTEPGSAPGYGTDGTSPSATPAPTSGSSPAPSGTSTPAPAATATPSPTSTSTPTPTSTSTPTPTQSPTEAPTSSPDGTALVSPSPTGTPLSSPTATPIPDLQTPTGGPTPVPTP